jgi:uncharacterized membrane protein YdjX (TVP38/TMEM64 family)
VKRFGPLVLLGGIMAIGFANGWHRYLSFQSLVENRAALGALVAANLPLALAGFMAIYVAAVALSFPGALFLTLAGGALFGGLLGGSATVIAATLGATLVFLIARASAGNATQKAGPLVEKLADGFRKDAFNYLLFLRLVPAFPFWLVNLAPALLGVRLPTFFTATAIGILPGTMAFSFVGAGLDSVLLAEAAKLEACRAAGRADCAVAFDVRSLVTPELLIALAAMGVVALIPIVVKKLRGKAAA